MRRTVQKWFWVWDFEKEEQWLCDMAARGLALVAVGFGKYEFEECSPGEYDVRMEFLAHKPTHPESVNYLSFLEEMGVEHVGSVQKWIYLRKKKESGPFLLHSDNSSRIKHLSRVIQFISLLAWLNLYIGCYNLYLYFFNPSPVSWINLLGILNLIVAVISGWGAFRLMKRRKKMRRDADLFE